MSERFKNSDPTVSIPNYLTIVWDSEKCKHMNQGEVVDKLNEQQDRIKQLEAQLNECRKPNPVERITTYI